MSIAAPEEGALIVGISGCSSSGKTTLSRLLRGIFPDSFILHEDDFYRPEDELPMKDGLLDWDCAGSLDIDKIAQALEYIRIHGALPPDLMSHEDQNTTGPSPVSQDVCLALKDDVSRITMPRICFLDGFLLYSPAMTAIRDVLDLRLFLQVSHAKAKERREARSGYVTLEGFWKDPEGYFDRVVWPNFRAEHRGMFLDGDVEGRLTDEAENAQGIRSLVGCDADMESVLKSSVKLIVDELPKLSAVKT